MKRMRIVGLCLVAAFAFSAIAVASASAEVLPNGQFGTCVKTTGGKYANAGCTEEKAGKTIYEWHPLAAGVHLTSKMKESTSATLETEKGTKVVCKKETGAGEVNNNGEGRGEAQNVTATFSECSSSGVPCQNKGGTSGVINTNTLSGVTGVEKAFIKEGKLIIAKDKMAEELHGPGGGLLAEFECGGFAIQVRGSVLHGVASGKMLSASTEKFTA